MKDESIQDTPALPESENTGDGAFLESGLGTLDAPTAEMASLDEIEEGFSPLELDDRVVISLLFNELIRIEHVEAAWQRARKSEQSGKPTKLWRALAQRQSRVEVENGLASRCVVRRVELTTPLAPATPPTR